MSSNSELDERVADAFNATCHGITIDIFDMSKVIRKGREAIEAGADDAELERVIRAYIETIRKN